MQAEVSKRWNVGDVILELYRVIDTLGEGGFGTVYKVRHQGWNIDLAVKSPKPEIVAAAGGVENFEREAETWVNLGLHPHTVSCYYVRCIESSPLVFAEYVAGGSLHDWIEQRQLYDGGAAASLQRILDIAIQFAWGLHYAHEQGLIHQDVKPANVMLTPDGVAKVTDFGLANERAIATILNSSLTKEGQGGSASDSLGDSSAASTPGYANAGLRPASLTGSLMVAGGGVMTPGYCSPEQANKETLTRRSDLWSWGLSVLEMFQGERTWPVGTIAAQALENYLETGPEDPQLPQMPVSVVELLRHCFQHHPDDRPHNMLEVASELLRIYQQVTGEAYPRPEPEAAKEIADSLNNRAVSLLDLGRQSEALQLWEQALSFQPRHPESTYNRGLVRWRSLRINDDTLVRELEAVRQSHAEDWITDYLLALVHLERDDCAAAIKTLESIQGAGAQQEEVQAARREAQERLAESKRLLRTFEGDKKRVNSVSISPDGRYALSGKHDGGVELWELVTGTCRTFEGHIGEGVQAVYFSPDGRYVVSLSNLTLKLWELATGLELWTFEVNHPETSVLMSPDGRYAVSEDPLTLTLREVATSLELYTLKKGGGSVCMSPDGRYALSVDGLPKLWEVATGRCLRTFEGHTKTVNSVCLSPNGVYALSGSSDNTLKLWEVATGRCVRTFKAHKGGVKSVCMSTDGRYALSGGHLTLKLWEVTTGRCLRTFGVADPVNSVCMSPDGRYAVSGGHLSLKLWEVNCTTSPYLAPMRLCRVQATETILSVRQVYEQELAQARAALSRGDAVAAAQHIRKARTQPGYSRDVEAFNAWAELYLCLPRKVLSGGWECATFTGHTSYVNSVVFSADSRLALSGSGDNTLKLWEVATGSCLRTFEGYFQGTVNSVCLSPDGLYALSGSHEGPMKLWEVATGRCLQTFEGDTAGAPSVCMSPDGRYALSGSNDGSLRLWEVATGRCLRTFEGYTSVVNAVCLSPDGRYALSGEGEKNSLGRGDDNTLKLWDVATGRCFRTFKGHKSGVASVCISPDGRYALSGSSDKTLKLWEVATSRCLRTFKGHKDMVASVCLSSDGRYVLSGSSDKTLKLWEIDTGSCLRTFEGYASVVKSVCLSLDGRYALSGSDDGSCKLWVLDWELEDQPPADWEERARAYLETFLTLHTPYAATLPQPEFEQQQIEKHNLEKHNRTQQFYSLLTRLFLISWAETAIFAAIFAINTKYVGWAAGMAVFIAGCLFGYRANLTALKFGSLFGVLALAFLTVGITRDEDRSVAFCVAFCVALGAIAGAIIGGAIPKIRDKIALVPEATVWNHLKTEVGTSFAQRILLLTAALGISLGIGSYLELLNPLVIFAVLATGLPLAWTIATKFSSSLQVKALFVAAVTAATILSAFNWKILSTVGLTPSAICTNSNTARNYLTHGGNPNNKVFYSYERPEMSLLHCAVLEGNKDIVAQLIAKSADVNAKTTMLISCGQNCSKKNVTPLHLAAHQADEDISKMLIAKGADVNARSNYGTPLHEAVEYGKKDIAELLIAKGADINARSNGFGTPLHIAVRKGNEDMAELLIAKGADVNARVEEFVVGTPLNLATKQGNTRLVELLKSHGGTE